MATHRTRRTVWLAAAAMTALAACGSSNGDDVNTNDLIDQLDDLGGPSVDDTTINHTNGSDTITIGGLTIVDARFETMEFFDDNNIVIPPTWPTLEIEQGDADFTQPEELWPTIGLAVLAQTETVTNDTTRQQLIDDVMRLAQLDDAELVHTSTTTNADTGITCWAEIRKSEPPRTPLFEQTGVIMIAGDGIASSGITIDYFGNGANVPDAVGDLVEAACGTRPDNL